MAAAVGEWPARQTHHELNATSWHPANIAGSSEAGSDMVFRKWVSQLVHRVVDF